MYISVKSQDFLDNLKVYLISSGKKESEINEIIEELEDHLHEAEKNGKNIDDIIGKSPKEYMEQVANELPFDMKALVKYIPILMLGAFAFILTGKAIRGALTFSIMELVGYPLIFLLYLFAIAAVFKYVSSRSLSKMKEWLVLSIVGVLPIGLILGLHFLNASVNTPAIAFGTVGNIITLICSIIIFIGIAIWSKSWVTIILPTLLFLPEGIINLTSLHESTKIILSGTLPFLLIGIYLVYVWYKDRQTKKTA